MSQHRSFFAHTFPTALVIIALAGCAGGDSSGGGTQDDALMGGTAGSFGQPTGGAVAGIGGGVAGTSAVGGAGTGGGAGTVAEVAGSGSLGTAGTGSEMAGSGGDPLPMGTFTPSRCTGDASKLAMIGDSYLALSGQITAYLQMYSGQTYTRTHYVSGTQMVGGLPPSIPDQFKLAMGQGEIETVIMDGGGNDVLLGDASCHATGPADGSMCQMTINKTMAGATQLFADMAAAGVKEVIFFFYPHVAGTNADLNPSLDYAYPLAADACANAPLDCKFIDTRADFMGHPEYIGIDGIHPTAPGSEAVAKRIWEVMQANCASGVVEK